MMLAIVMLPDGEKDHEAIRFRTRLVYSADIVINVDEKTGRMAMEKYRHGPKDTPVDFATLGPVLYHSMMSRAKEPAGVNAEAVRVVLRGCYDRLESSEHGEYEHDKSEFRRGVLAAACSCLQILSMGTVYLDDLYTLLTAHMSKVDSQTRMTPGETSRMEADVMKLLKP